MKTSYIITKNSEQQTVTVEDAGEGAYRVMVAGEEVIVDACHVGPHEYHLLHENVGGGYQVDGAPPAIVVHSARGTAAVELLDERQAARQAAVGSHGESADGSLSITSPMPGKVVKCLVSEGDEVTSGQGIIIVEAMKMENELRTSMSGEVLAIKVAEGDNVNAGECLVTIEQR